MPLLVKNTLNKNKFTYPTSHKIKNIPVNHQCFITFGDDFYRQKFGFNYRGFSQRRSRLFIIRVSV